MQKMKLDWETVWEQLDRWYRGERGQPPTWGELKDEFEKVVEAQLRQQNAA